MNSLKDPFLEWLISTSNFKRRVWILEAQLYRLVLKISKNEDFVDLYKKIAEQVASLELFYPETLNNYINTIERSYIKILFSKFDGRVDNFRDQVKQTKGFI